MGFGDDLAILVLDHSVPSIAVLRLTGMGGTAGTGVLCNDDSEK